MRTIDIMRRSGRNLRQAKMRTVLTALAIAVGGFTLTLTLAAATGARQYADNLIEANFDPNAVLVSKDEAIFSGAGDTSVREYDESLGAAFGAQFQMLDRQDVDKIQAMDHVDDVLEGYINEAQYITREGAGRYTAGLYVFDPGVQPELKAGSIPEGDLADGTIVMPEDYLEPLGFASADEAIGKTISAHVQRASGEVRVFEFEVAAVSTRSALQQAFEPSSLYLSRGDSRAIHDFVNAGSLMEGRFLYVTATAKGVDADELKQELEAAGFVAMTAADAQELLNQIISVLQGIVVVFGLIALIASFFGVVNTQYISVLERTREIGLMKALGASRRVVSRLFIVEATWIGFLGAALGSLLAIGLGAALNPWISEQLNFGDERLLVFGATQVAGLIIFLMLVTTIAGLLPARKAAKLDPIEALRTE